jgi:hypothetical protein
MLKRISPAAAPPGALARIILLASLWLGLPARADADAYYSVTDLGLIRDWQQMSLSGTIENLKTGATYPFPTSSGYPYPFLTDSERASLPGVDRMYGATNPREMFFPMQVLDGNAAGTVIGGVPSNSSGYPDLVGYAVLSPSGQWSKFVPLSGQQGNGAGTVELSHEANRILVNDALRSVLVNPADGSVTPIAQLVSPDIAKKFGSFGGIFGQGIDDRGDILAVGANPSGPPEALLLTPAGLAAPAAAPEPSTLVGFTLLGAATIARLRRPRPADHPAR